MPKTYCRAALVGLDGAGKSSIVMAFQGRRVLAPGPTQGCNKSCLHRLEAGTWVSRPGAEPSSFALELLDLGGSDAMRPYWQHVCSDVDALIAVVDATETDAERWATIALELERLRKGSGDDQEGVVPMLTLLNRKGVPLRECAPPKDDIMRLGLNNELGVHALSISSSADSAALRAGLNWLWEVLAPEATFDASEGEEAAYCSSDDEAGVAGVEAGVASLSRTLDQTAAAAAEAQSQMRALRDELENTRLAEEAARAKELLATQVREAEAIAREEEAAAAACAARTLAEIEAEEEEAEAEAALAKLAEETDGAPPPDRRRTTTSATDASCLTPPRHASPFAHLRSRDAAGSPCDERGSTRPRPLVTSPTQGDLRRPRGDGRVFRGRLAAKRRQAASRPGLPGSAGRYRLCRQMLRRATSLKE